MFLIIFTVLSLHSAVVLPVQQTPAKEITIDVVQILDLPVAITHATLVKAKDGNTQELWKAYLQSDYSAAPRVIRTTNYTDAPMKNRILY